MDATKDKRIGRFEVSDRQKEYLSHDPSKNKAFLGAITNVETVTNADGSTFHKAESILFDAVAQGQHIPWYDIVIDEKQAFSVSKREKEKLIAAETASNADIIDTGAVEDKPAKHSHKKVAKK